MKVILFILAIIKISTIELSAQIDEIRKIEIQDLPEAVINAYTSEFSDAYEVTWGKVKGLSYQANLVQDSYNLSLLYRAEGGLIYKRKKISQDELSADILKYVKTEYPKMEIHHISQEINKVNRVYVFELKGDERKVEFKLEF